MVNCGGENLIVHILASFSWSTVCSNLQSKKTLAMSKNKQVKYCVVDAFTEAAFKGNPAAVCLLEDERDDDKWLQLVATEFNLSETCFLTRCLDSESTHLPRFGLRWFTPVAEVELCGHATLAASHFIFSTGLVNANIIEFMTLSGVLTARRVSQPEVSSLSQLNNGNAGESFCIELDFPVVPLTEFTSAEVSTISESLSGASVVDIKKTTTEDDLFVVLSSGKTVAELEPLFDEIQKLPCRGMTVTGLAPSESGFDIYSRYFCPKFGIKEDPVTGSAHCALAPYWCQKLGKRDLIAYQASPRGGTIRLHLDEKNQRVLLQGKAITVMEGLLLV